MKIPSKAEFNSLLAIVLIIGGFLYFRGVSFGLPFFYHYDEPSLVQIGARVVQDGQFNPKWFHYPSLSGYLQSAAYALSYLVVTARAEEYVTIQEFPLHVFYLWGRSLTVILALATILSTALLSARIGRSQITGVVAALILTLSSGFSAEARYITPNVPSAFFAVLAVLFFCRARKRSQLVVAGLMTGFAIGCKYNLMILLLPMIVTTLFSRSDEAIFSNIKDSINILGAAILGFIASSPFVILELPTFLNQFCFELRHYRTAGHVGAEGNWNILYYLKHLFTNGLGPPIFVCTALGIIWTLFKDRKTLLQPVYLFPILYITVLSTMKVNFVRNLTPLYPFLAIWAGHFVTNFTKSIHQRLGLKFARFTSVVLLLFALIPAWQIVVYGGFLQEKDNRTIAREWIIENIPTNSKVYVETQRRAKHPYGGLTTAPTLPEDLFDLVLVKDLLKQYQPSEFWMRNDVYIVSCLDNKYYSAHYGERGEQVMEEWLAGAQVIKQFPWSPSRPGKGIRIFKTFNLAESRKLLRSNEDTSSFANGSLETFLGVGWEPATNTYNEIAYRWSTGNRAEILLPINRRVDHQISIKLFFHGEPTGDDKSFLTVEIGQETRTSIMVSSWNEWTEVSIAVPRSHEGLDLVSLLLDLSAAKADKIAISKISVIPTR